MKPCIIHGCMPKTNQCDCEDAVSQADVFTSERLVDYVPALFGMLPDNCEEGIDVHSKGQFLWVEQTTRSPDMVETTTISFRRA